MSDLIGIIGSWKLAVWKRIAANGLISFPLGEHAKGLLIYTADGAVIVQMTASDRALIGTSDALRGGTLDQRADAYSTCLAYFGRYELKGDELIHTIEASLFPDWSGQQQIRPFTLDGDSLTLRTPPVHLPSGDVTNELIWTRTRCKLSTI